MKKNSTVDSLYILFDLIKRKYSLEKREICLILRKSLRNHTLTLVCCKKYTSQIKKKRKNWKNCFIVVFFANCTKFSNLPSDFLFLNVYKMQNSPIGCRCCFIFCSFHSAHWTTFTLKHHRHHKRIKKSTRTHRWK